MQTVTAALACVSFSSLIVPDLEMGIFMTLRTCRTLISMLTDYCLEPTQTTTASTLRFYPVQPRHIRYTVSENDL